MIALRRSRILGAAVIAASAIAGLASSQAPAPLGPAATPFDLQPDRAEAAALDQARQNPFIARLRGVSANLPQVGVVLDQAASSNVPVLAPADPGLLQTARFYPADTHYTLVVRPPGRIVEIYGTTRAFRPADPVRPGATAQAPVAARAPQRTTAARAEAQAQALAQARARGLETIIAERTEYGVDVAFSRFGAAYNVTFVCDAQGPPDCDEAAAIRFAAGLELIGGGG
ncbi:hypothetical protein [Brevundimonas balnearis]|uniref:Uncharacterized protein n=1 Tax=Brevundimonas balnearis TaxID=1572858 RepID=A0ABV6QZR8_9CAUL